MQLTKGRMEINEKLRRLRRKKLELVSQLKAIRKEIEVEEARESLARIKQRKSISKARYVECLRLKSRGLTWKQVGEIMGVSENQAMKAGTSAQWEWRRSWERLSETDAVWLSEDERMQENERYE